MTSKTFRPAPSWEGERAETVHFAGEQICRHDNKNPVNHQEISVINYSVDARLNVVRVNFGPLRSGVQS